MEQTMARTFGHEGVSLACHGHGCSRLRDSNHAVQLDDDDVGYMSFACVAHSLFQLAWIMMAIQPPKRLGFRCTYLIAFVTPIITEAPVLLLAIKLWSMRWAMNLDAFADPLASVVLGIDLVTIAGFVCIIYLACKTKSIVELETKEFEKCGPKLPNLLSWSIWLRMIWPLFAQLDVKIVRDVVYATPKEVKEAGPKGASFLKLDIYKPRDASESDKRPVLMYIHGGVWMFGDKFIPNPHYWNLASQGWIVVTVNYRLSPTYRFPTHLIDCKRALRWIKENIDTHGGDPNFVCASGDSAGSHMAELIALTQNEAKYQPGFENTLTDVKACVAINGVHDLTNKHGVLCKGNRTANWFAKDICGLTTTFEDPKTRELIMSYSPECLVEKHSKGGSSVVPFMVFHGGIDNIVDVRHTRAFVETFKKRFPDTKVTYMEYPGGHHGYYNANSVRTYCQAIAMTRFLNWVHRGYTDEGVDLDYSKRIESSTPVCL